MQHKIVITRHRPWFKTAVVGGVVAAVLVSGFSLWAYTRRATVSEFRAAKTEAEQLREERRDLARQLRAAKSEMAELREQVVYVERSGKIDAQACGSVKESLASLQAEAADLREQVAFYRGIVSPDESRAGVRVLDMKITPQAAARVYRYDLVLIQSVRHDRRVSGNVELKLLGSQGGQQQTLDLQKLLTAQDAASPRFAFKYFQEFGGEFRLPDGFRPLRVTVTLVPETDNSPRVEDEYEWGRIQVSRTP